MTYKLFPSGTYHFDVTNQRYDQETYFPFATQLLHLKKKGMYESSEHASVKLGWNAVFGVEKVPLPLAMLVTLGSID